MNCSQYITLFNDPPDIEKYSAVILALNYFCSIIIQISKLSALVTNILCVIVLLHKEMRKSGVNLIMIFIASSDWLTFVTSIVSSVIFQCSPNNSFSQMFSQLIALYFIASFHAYSLVLAVGMGFFRVMALRDQYSKSQKWSSRKYAFFMALTLFVPSFLFSFAHPFIAKIKEVRPNYYELVDNQDDDCMMMKWAYFMNGVFFKMIPCVLIATFSIIILKKMPEIKTSRQITMGRRFDASEFNRSSQLILAVLLIFLICEIPQVIANILTVLSIRDFFLYVGPIINLFLDAVTIVHSSSSLVIYCFLSAKFRELFRQIILGKKRNVVVPKLSTVSA